jgi:hypothetical protein
MLFFPGGLYTFMINVGFGSFVRIFTAVTSLNGRWTCSWLVVPSIRLLMYIADRGGCCAFVAGSTRIHDASWIGNDFVNSDYRCSCNSRAVKFSEPELKMLSVDALLLFRLHCSNLIVDVSN